MTLSYRISFRNNEIYFFTFLSFILKVIFTSFGRSVSSSLVFVWQGFGIRVGATEVASVRYCQKLPSCPKQLSGVSKKFRNEAKPRKKGGM